MTAQAAPLFCVCWSCDGQCGGTGDLTSCGPTVTDADGHPICEVCRAKADVFDVDRNGVQATIGQDCVRLNVDTFGRGPAAYLTVAGARELARVLLERARELEAGQLPSQPAAEVTAWARQLATGSRPTLKGTPS